MQIRSRFKLARLPNIPISVLYFPNLIRDVNNLVRFLLGCVDHAFNYPLHNRIRSNVTLNSGATLAAMQSVECANIAAVIGLKAYGTVGDNCKVIDIGAHIGAYSIFAATSAKNTLVYAFEPVDQNYFRLVRHIRSNHIQNVVPFKLAVSCRKGIRKIYLGRKSTTHSLYSVNASADFIKVECVRLKDIFDDHLPQGCDILKMNCEGAEYEVLYTTPSKYLGKIGKIRMEYHNIDTGKRNVSSLMDYLAANGFRIVRHDIRNRVCGIIWADRLVAHNTN